jgi:hypothetical protein
MRTRRGLVSQPPLLSELAPEFASELARALGDAGHSDLARAVPGLLVVEPCTCNQPDCASFYAVPRFQASWLWGHRGKTIQLAGEGGLIGVDVVYGRMLAIEVARHDPLRASVRAAGTALATQR